eukprot:315847-Prymnesium_polylepis.2
MLGRFRQYLDSAAHDTSLKPDLEASAVRAGAGQHICHDAHSALARLVVNLLEHGNALAGNRFRSGGRRSPTA